MEHYFSKYREQIVGINQKIATPYHDSIAITYADWTASGRMYAKIEERFQEVILPMVANTHTDTNDTGQAMTYAYHKAKQIIKQHVGATEDDVLISASSGMTGVVNKLQRILGFKIHESFRQLVKLDEENVPIVLITHMEHHSNQTSWLETIGEVEIVPPDENGLVSISNFEKALQKYASRKTKIAAITSCSNVTGIVTPYMDIAALMHQHEGLCFVDFACSAPYIDINMHEDDEAGRHLDAIYFSPHKFLGGPGSSGVVVFSKKLYHNTIPDTPGGGTVDWTNPWKGHKYVDDIEAREDGGTPAFLQTIRTAMCCQLKDEMGVVNILKREHEILDIIWEQLVGIPNLHILAEENKDRLGVISFYIDGLHYNVGVKMLNDRFGIQTRGGCSCAGTYGHFLLNVDPEKSNKITSKINMGDCSLKPGWIRMSIHPTHTNQEIHYILDGIKQLAANHSEWAKDYEIDFAEGIIKPKFNRKCAELEQKMDACFFGSYA